MQSKTIKKQQMLTKAARYAITAGLFLVFFYIAAKVPYCHDEWQWGLDERIKLMKNGFKDYNGRYLGNILALIITRSIPAKALIISAGSISLFYILFKCSGTASAKGDRNQSVFFMLVTVFLLMTIPRSMFQQIYGWPAAFVNFVPPVIFFLIWYHWSSGIYYGYLPAYSKTKLLLVIPLGICTQLFSENITLFTVVYAFWVILYCRIRYHKTAGSVPVLYFISCIAGALLMFSNGAYRKAAAGTDGYKNITLSVSGLFTKFSDEIAGPLFLNNWILNMTLAVLLTILAVHHNRRTLIHSLSVVVINCYAAYSVFHAFYPSWVFTANESANHKIQALIALLFYFSILLCIYNFPNTSDRINAAIPQLCALAVAAPLLAASPIGPRCIYVCVVFQMLTALRLTFYVIRDIKIRLWFPALALAALVLTMSGIYVKMFHNIGQVNNLRQQIIETSVAENKTEIVLPVLPYSEYCWITVPPTEKWAKRFKEFYHIPADTVVKFE